MTGCIFKLSDGRCDKPGRYLSPCIGEACAHQTPTNADRIRAMSDKELADFINDTEYGFIERPGMCDVCDHHRIKDCLRCWLDWLKSPVQPGEVGNGNI